MSLYARPGSRYWWMYLEGASKPQQSTKIPRVAATPEQTRRNRLLAETIYHQTIADLRAERHGLRPKAEIGFTAYAEWYRNAVTSQKRGEEREAYALEVLLSAFGHLPLHRVDKPTVQGWIASRASQVSAGTVNRELDVLKHMLASAVPKYLAESPIKGLARVRAKRGTKEIIPVVISPKDEEKLLVVLTPRDQALVTLAICTLFRLGDLLDLEWKHVHGTWIEAPDTKPGRHVKIPLSTRARKALAALKHARNAVYVFPDRRKGTPAERRNRIKMMLSWACKKAKVKYGRSRGGITFHSFRHTGATRMLSAGVDPRTVQQIGDWSSLAQVMRYTHPTDQQRRSAVEHI